MRTPWAAIVEQRRARLDLARRRAREELAAGELVALHDRARLLGDHLLALDEAGEAWGEVEQREVYGLLGEVMRAAARAR